MPITIVEDKCVGCQACLKVCPYEAIDMVEKKAVMNENCIQCGVCVEACKFEAILREAGEGGAFA